MALAWAPATWTGVEDAVAPVVPVALEPLVAVAFEPPAEGEAEVVAFLGSTAGAYWSQTAPSASGHCRRGSQFLSNPWENRDQNKVGRGPPLLQTVLTEEIVPFIKMYE